MADPAEYLDLGVRELAARGLEVVDGKHAVPVAPDDQRRTRMMCDRLEQIASPLRLDTTRGAHEVGHLVHEGTAAGLG